LATFRRLCDFKNCISSPKLGHYVFAKRPLISKLETLWVGLQFRQVLEDIFQNNIGSPCRYEREFFLPVIVYQGRRQICYLCFSSLLFSPHPTSIKMWIAFGKFGDSVPVRLHQYNKRQIEAMNRSNKTLQTKTTCNST
jgi:hypothetical protein